MILETILDSLEKWSPAEQEVRQIRASDWLLELQADRCDSLSARYRQITLKREAAPEGETVDTWARRVAGLAVFPGRLAVIEVDDARKQAIVRTEAPSEARGSFTYVEMLVEGTQAVTIRKYQTIEENRRKRTQRPFVLSHEVLATLVESLVE